MTFTTEKPMLPGAYWWRSTAIENLPGAHFLIEIYESGSRLFAWRDGKAYTDNVWKAWVGEWSSRLVPVEEVEKAFHEGWNNCAIHAAWGAVSDPRWNSGEMEYEHSRARRVVEGREV